MRSRSGKGNRNRNLLKNLYTDYKCSTEEIDLQEQQKVSKEEEQPTGVGEEQEDDCNVP